MDYTNIYFKKNYNNSSTSAAAVLVLPLPVAITSKALLLLPQMPPFLSVTNDSATLSIACNWEVEQQELQTGSVAIKGKYAIRRTDTWRIENHG